MLVSVSLRIAITGADGFVGRHVVDAARSRGHVVTRILRHRTEDGQQSGDFSGVDLTGEWPDMEVDVVIHLAAQAAVGASFARPMNYIQDNSAMVVTMCESLIRHERMGTRVIMASSGAIYAPSPSKLDEESAVAFTSPYVVSKVLCENLLDYYRRRGVDTICVRPFNHIGPGQTQGFLVPDLVQRLRGLRDGEALEVGDLTTSRDYTDVRDVAAAYLLLAEAGHPRHSLYNVSSGKSRSGYEVLSGVCGVLGRDMPQTVVAPAAMRPVDNPVVVGDARRIRDEFGWHPTVSFDTSIQDAVGEI